MKHKSYYLVLGVLLAATLACSVLSPEAPTPTTAKVSTAAKVPTLAAATAAKVPTLAAPTSKAVFTDDFASSKSGWSVNENDNGSAAYLNGQYVFKFKRAKWLKWSTTPDGNDYTNVHLEMTASDTSAAKDTLPAFGFICNYQDEKNFLYAGMAMDGVYAIALKLNGEATKILTNDKNEWANTSQIAKNQTSYRLGADCTPNGVTLYVDGKKIATATNSSISGGAVGVFALTFDSPNGEVRFDDFAVSPLK